MAIEPTKRISETPKIRREDNAVTSLRKKPKQQKNEEKDDQRKVDIRV